MGQESHKFSSNLVNADALDAYVERFADRTRHDAGKAWWRKNFRNYVLRTEALVVRIKDRRHLELLQDMELVETNLGDWVERDLQRNRPLHYFDELKLTAIPSGIFAPHRQSPRLLSDWMNALSDDDRRWRRFGRTSVPEAMDMALRWRRAEVKEAQATFPDDPDGIRPLMHFKDGFDIVQITSDSARNRESAVMRHCLHRYDVRRDGEFFSIRGPDNRPHVTMEVSGGWVLQIRGFANSLPKRKYRKYILAFLRRFNLSFSGDGEAMGFIQSDGMRFSSIDDCIFGFERWARRHVDLATLPKRRCPRVNRLLSLVDRHWSDVGTDARRALDRMFKAQDAA